MSNYPAGSMRGSGIYSTAGVINLTCTETIEQPEMEEDDECTFDGDVEVIWNDWHVGLAICPQCGAEHEIEAPDKNDYEPPDEDR